MHTKIKIENFIISDGHYGFECSLSHRAVLILITRVDLVLLLVLV